MHNMCKAFRKSTIGLRILLCRYSVSHDYYYLFNVIESTTRKCTNQISNEPIQQNFKIGFCGFSLKRLKGLLLTLECKFNILFSRNFFYMIFIITDKVEEINQKNRLKPSFLAPI